MMPPTSIDGTDITGATIDGTDVQEITVDGQTVFTAGPNVPDAVNLYARYSADTLSLADGDPVNTWADQTNNGFDLTQGVAATFESSGFNSNPVVEFDGNNDNLEVQWGVLSQPYHVFLSFKMLTLPSDKSYILNPEVATNGSQWFGVDNRTQFGISDAFSMAAGGTVRTNNTADTNPHIASLLYDGGSSDLRIDGSSIASGDAGTFPLDGFMLGGRPSGSDMAHVQIGEVLVYEVNNSSNDATIETYLSKSWGIAV